MMSISIDPYYFFLTWTDEEIKDYFRTWNVDDLVQYKKDLEDRQLFEYCVLIRDILIEKT